MEISLLVTVCIWWMHHAKAIKCSNRRWRRVLGKNRSDSVIIWGQISCWEIVVATRGSKQFVVTLRHLKHSCRWPSKNLSTPFHVPLPAHLDCSRRWTASSRAWSGKHWRAFNMSELVVSWRSVLINACYDCLQPFPPTRLPPGADRQRRGSVSVGQIVLHLSSLLGFWTVDRT